MKLVILNGINGALVGVAGFSITRHWQAWMLIIWGAFMVIAAWQIGRDERKRTEKGR